MEKSDKSQCQIHSLAFIPLPFRAIDRIGYLLRRGKRFLKRRWNYLVNVFREKNKPEETSGARVIEIERREGLQPGDTVRIRSRQEILSTLDNWNQSRGCAFMEEMWGFCGSVQKVHKCVRKFLDERDYKVKKCSGIVILEGITCEGTKDFGDCDRSCFYFWREEWLEKVAQESASVKEPGQKNVQYSRSE